MKETFLGKLPREISTEEARVELLWRRGIWMSTLSLKGATLQTEKLSTLQFLWVINRLAITIVATRLQRNFHETFRRNRTL